MEIIYKNEDPKIQEAFKIGLTIRIFQMLYEEDLITKEELDALLETIKKHFDINDLCRHIEEKYRKEND